MLRLFTDSRCLEHRAPGGFPERPERLTRIVSHLRVHGWNLAPESLLEDVKPAAHDAVLAVHDGAYVDRFQRAVERGDGLLDSADNPLSASTWDAAWAAVECSLAGADWVIRPGAPVAERRAFVAVRPPGHHAERAMAMGFCYFNNVAVAAQYLQDRHGLGRIAILDFDVHHGNGTQHLFETRGDVFYASLHQYPFYPGTGAAAERGLGAGEGATLNVPLPAGTGDPGYLAAMADEVLPTLRRFAPEVLVVSAGFDAWKNDPLGGMQVSAEGFERWGRMLGAFADAICGGRVLSLLEGGYDLTALPMLVERYLVGLIGKEIETRE